MHKKVEKIKKLREFLLADISSLDEEQLNKIPAGFNNNIIWNLGHLICAQQSICYLRAGQLTVVADKYISPFFTNTKPAMYIERKEILEIKELFISLVDELQNGLEKKIFDNYTPSPNILKVYGVTLTNIEDALDFLLYHEGFHAGYITSLKRLVT